MHGSASPAAQGRLSFVAFLPHALHVPWVCPTLCDCAEFPIGVTVFCIFMAACSPFERVPPPILSVILGMVACKQVTRLVNRSWRDLLPKPQPTPGLRNFDFTSWLYPDVMHLTKALKTHENNCRLANVHQQVQNVMYLHQYYQKDPQSRPAHAQRVLFARKRPHSQEPSACLRYAGVDRIARSRNFANRVCRS